MSKRNKTLDLDMLHGSIGDKTLKFALPLAATGILQQLFTAADTAIIGRFAGTAAQAAVGCNVQTTSLLYNTIIGISVGVNVIVAGCIGRDDKEAIRKSVHTSILFAFLSGIFITIFSEIIGGWLLHAMSVPDKIFDMVRRLRRDVTIPMLFMTYANVVFSYGSERFIATCADIGIDALILPDIPYEEKDEFDPICKRYGVDLISLVAPTSAERIAMVAKEASGFIYVVSSLGVTGVRSEITTDIGAMVQLIRENTKLPCAVGFGISTPEQARKMASLSDGAIVGSAIVKLIAQYGREAVPYVADYVKRMKDAVRQA